jgi:hypothetical protein
MFHFQLHTIRTTSRSPSTSFPILDEFWEAIEVRDVLPSVLVEFGKPTHNLTWRNLTIFNARRKLYSKSWLLDGTFESLTAVIVAEKTVEMIGITRTE